MKNACTSLVRPNLPPLRRPATWPGVGVPSPLTGRGSGLEPDRHPASGETNKRDHILPTAKDASAMIPAPVTLKFCNYCGQQGKLRCTRCKKTCYCSVSCQAEDWKAHRHICKSSVPEVHPSQKLTECNPPTPAGGARELDLMVRGNCGGGGQKKRVFVQDLRKNNLSKGAEIQATIVEVRSPGKFFIHVQSAAMIDALRSISVELQKLSGTSACSLYRPQEGEICSVKYTQDQNWYRGLIQAVDAEQQSASVLYIDFGNEEVASFDRIKPLPPGVDPIAPCALQCRVAAVTPVMTDWTGECNIAMRQLVYGKTLTVSIVGALDNSAVFPVDVTLAQIGKTLSSFLIEQGYATKEASVPNKPRTEQEIKSILNASFENFKRLLGDKDENVEAQPPEPLSQGIGDTFSSVVTHLQSPYEIICQKLENTSIIQEMQIKLREHCLNTQASENFRPAPGTACCSQFLEDSQWYRAKVLAYSSEERVCVGYIDFGNSEEVELSRLRPISTELLELPAQAIPCSLAGVRPRTDTWSEEAVITLKMLVCNRFIRVEILGEWEGRALVAMVDEVSDPQSNIAELLVSSGHAVPETLEAWLTDSPSSPAEPTAASTPVKQKLQWSCAELPSEGQMVALVVSMIENPGEFYCYHYNSEGMQRLVEISADLQNHCQDAADSSFSPVVGEPCCARFTDGNWYRAMVKAVGHDGKVQVYFVDYGNTCELHPSQLKPVDSRLLKHPFQAIRCCLAGVEPYDGQWSKAAIQRFRALCEAKQLEGRVLSITERGYGVELKSESHIITATLLMERLATPTAMPTKSLATSLSPASPKKNEAAVACSLPSTNQKEVLAAPAMKNAESTPVAASSAAFALDWKTSELPPNEPFTPRVAAVISPSLFFVMNPGIVKAEGMQALMIEVGKYCRQAAPSHARPLPGAACCALFSGDKTWYRAIVVDTRDEDVTVVYADYGNVEKVPYSSILPVPAQLLQPPFQTVRCTLAGGEGEKFPSSWPAEALEIFTSLLGGELQATAQGFDGTSNLLRLSWGVEQVSSILLACQKNPLDGPALASAINSRSPAEESLHPSPSDNKLETLDGPRAAPASCCCEHLNQKLDRVEKLLLLLLQRSAG